MVAHAKHFAAKVSQRRRRLGMTFTDVNRNGGPTAPTVAKAEAGGLDDPRPSTLSKFDTGLRWQPGSAASTYWDGEEPRPCETPSPRSPLEPAGGNVSLPLERVLALMKTQGQLNDLVEQPGKSVSSERLKPLVEALNVEISSILGVFVTELLERNHSSGTAMQPLLEYAFAELLAAPVSPKDPDRDEKLYRRWLLGNTHEMSVKQQRVFELRLRSRLQQAGEAS